MSSDSKPNPAPNAWKFEAQRGYFSHDDDPESWSFRATTQPNLGLIERTYPNEIESDTEHVSSQWLRLQRHIADLNSQDPTNKKWKVLYLVRHGEGVHNVVEKEYGRSEWDRYWAKQDGDGKVHWLDAELTPTGEQQARDISTFFQSSEVPAPQSIYSSPLRRCLRTTLLAFDPFMKSDDAKVPVIKEKLRERLGVHTCDRRSSKSWITEAYPEFEVEQNFAKTDELWQADRRETLEEHAVRSTELLNNVFAHDDNEIISLTAHSGAIMALFEATGWKKIPVAAAAVYPLLVCATKT